MTARPDSHTIKPDDEIAFCLKRANECERAGKIEEAQQWREEAKDWGWKP